MASLLKVSRLGAGVLLLPNDRAPIGRGGRLRAVLGCRLEPSLTVVGALVVDDVAVVVVGVGVIPVAVS